MASPIKKEDEATLPFEDKEGIIVEKSIITKAIESQEFFVSAAERLSKEMFTWKVARDLWAIMDNYTTNNAKWTPAILAKELERLKYAEPLGFVNGLRLEVSPGPCNSITEAIETEIKTIRDMYMLRKWRDAGINAFKNYGPSSSTFDLVTKGRAVLEEMGASIKSCAAMPIIQVAEGMAALVSQGKKKHFVKTSIAGLQAACGGLCGGKLYIFAARPSVGKTAIGVQLALDAAQDGAHAVYFSTESDKETMTARILANVGNLDSFDIERGRICPQTLLSTAGRIPPKLLIADKSPVIWAMLSFMRKWRAEHKGPAVFFVDYLELVSYPKAPSIQERVSEVITLLQQASKELDVAMVVMSQLNRTSTTEAVEPELHHIRSSGMVEQAADFCGLLFYDKDAQLWMKIAKNRISGRLARIPLRIEAKHSRVTEGVKDSTGPAPVEIPCDF